MLPSQSVLIAKVTGNQACATSQQIHEAVRSLWAKHSQGESFPEPKDKAKLASSTETEAPAKTALDLKPSVPLATELSYKTKTNSESTWDTIQFVPDPELLGHRSSSRS